MIYLDQAAPTPVSPEAAQAMVEVLTKRYGNPSAQYALGREANALVGISSDRERFVELLLNACASYGKGDKEDE